MRFLCKPSDYEAQMQIMLLEQPKDIEVKKKIYEELPSKPNQTLGAPGKRGIDWAGKRRKTKVIGKIPQQQKATVNLAPHPINLDQSSNAQNQKSAPMVKKAQQSISFYENALEQPLDSPVIKQDQPTQFVTED